MYAVLALTGKDTDKGCTVSTAAQQGVCQGDVSRPDRKRQAVAVVQARLRHGVSVEHALRSGRHGEVQQVAHLPLKPLQAVRVQFGS